MTPLEAWFVAVGGLIMVLFWGWAIIRVKMARERKVPDEVSETSHAVKNEVMQVRASLKEISRSPDPAKALVDAMTGKEDGRYH